MNRTIFSISLLFLFLLSLPQNASDQIRSHTVSCLLPFWKLGQVVPTPKIGHAKAISQPEELRSLQLENYQLKSQLDLVYEWIHSEKRLNEQIDQFRLLQKGPSTDFLKRRTKEIGDLLQAQAIAAFGRILYRDPGSWSSSCWIDVGEENNQALGQTIIAKNSPVVAGSSLIGIIEFVGKRQSRVRFITDSGLKTAVRAVRGSILDRELALSLDNLIQKIKKHPRLKNSSELSHLLALQGQLECRFDDGYFAKGEIFGSSAPYHRSLKSKLKGIGFNCDVKDIEGPARNLQDDAVLQVGDFLLTSGLDGVFPPGLQVARVSKVFPLRGGAYAYDLEAEPTAGNIYDLTAVSVLPPLKAE